MEEYTANYFIASYFMMVHKCDLCKKVLKDKAIKVVVDFGHWDTYEWIGKKIKNAKNKK